MADTFRLQLLIMEDRDDHREQLVSWFNMEAEKAGLPLTLDIATATYTNDVRRLLQQRLFHAASLDQSMPESSGGQTDLNHGMTIARHMKELGNPPLFAMFTAFGNAANANSLGQETGMSFKLKATETRRNEDGEAMAFADYARWFLHDFFANGYIPQVLKLAEQSALQDIRQQARDAQACANSFLQHPTPDAVRLFMPALDKLREALLKHLVAFTAMLTEKRDVADATFPKDGQTAGVFIKWLRSAWEDLEQTEDPTFLTWKQFLGLEEEERMACVYLDRTISPLNRVRNNVIHKGHEYSLPLWNELLPATLRTMHLLAWLATRPLLAVPQRRDPQMLSCVDYRHIIPQPRELFYPVEEDLPNHDPASALFTRFSNSDDEPLRHMSNGYALQAGQAGRPAVKRLTT